MSGAITSGAPAGPGLKSAPGSVWTGAAVIAALLDALAPLGVRHIDMPATPERVWQAIRGAA